MPPRKAPPTPSPPPARGGHEVEGEDEEYEEEEEEEEEHEASVAHTNGYADDEEGYEDEEGPYEDEEEYEEEAGSEQPHARGHQHGEAASAGDGEGYEDEEGPHDEEYEEEYEEEEAAQPSGRSLGAPGGSLAEDGDEPGESQLGDEPYGGEAYEEEEDEPVEEEERSAVESRRSGGSGWGHPVAADSGRTASALAPSGAARTPTPVSLGDEATQSGAYDEEELEDYEEESVVERSTATAEPQSTPGHTPTTAPLPSRAPSGQPPGVSTPPGSGLRPREEAQEEEELSEGGDGGAFTDVYTTDPDGSPTSEDDSPDGQTARANWLGSAWGSLSQVRPGVGGAVFHQTPAVSQVACTPPTFEPRTPLSDALLPGSAFQSVTAGVAVAAAATTGAAVAASKMVPTELPTVTAPQWDAGAGTASGVIAVGSGVRQAAAVAAPAREAAAAAVAATSEALDAGVAAAHKASSEALSQAHSALMAAPAALSGALAGTASAAAAGAASVGAALAAVPGAVMAARLPPMPELPQLSLPSNGYVAFDKHNRTWTKGDLPLTGPRANTPHSFAAMPVAPPLVPRVKTPPRVVPVPVPSPSARLRRPRSYESVVASQPPPGLPLLLQLRAATHRLRSHVTDWWVAPLMGPDAAYALSALATFALFAWLAGLAFTAGEAIYEAGLRAMLGVQDFVLATSDSYQLGAMSRSGALLHIASRLLVVASALGAFGFGANAVLRPYLRAPQYRVPPRTGARRAAAKR